MVKIPYKTQYERLIPSSANNMREMWNTRAKYLQQVKVPLPYSCDQEKQNPTLSSPRT